MQKIIISILAYLLFIQYGVVACSDDTEHRPPSPAPDEQPMQEHIIPEIILGYDPLIVYPFGTGIPAVREFSIKGLEEDAVVTVDSSVDLKASLSVEKTTGSCVLSVVPTDIFSVDSRLIITAENGDSVAQTQLEVQEAYVMGAFDDNEMEPFPFAQKVPVYTNTGGFSVSTKTPWITIEIVAPDECFVFSVTENTGRKPRTGEIVLTDAAGVLRHTISVIQKAPDHTQEITGERAALEEIYRRLHGEDWTDSENWCTDAPLKSWYGVMTNTFKGEEHVVYLHLQYVGAHGELPEAIGELKYLRELWIIGNEGITGTIPSSLGGLTDLRDLTISGTSVSGMIPPRLGSPKKLEILGLDDNRLEGNLPLFLKDLPALYNFGFSQNCLDGQIDRSLTETRWWNTPDSSTGNKMGEENLSRGQKEGHRLWL